MIKERNEILNRIDEINATVDDLYREAFNKPEEERHVFHRKCSSEGCKGFLSSQWKCAICEKYTCKDCNEIKREGHECDPQKVETMKLIKSDCKPCPKCAEIIHKIDGCDQMWCPSCHVSFSWKSGREIKGAINHNPHYYEYMRQANGEVPRNPQDLPCGELIDIGFIINQPDKPGYHSIANAHRIIREANHYIIPYLPDTNTFTEPDTDIQRLRLKYMLNKITDERFKQVLQKMSKKRQKLWDYKQILQMMSATATDIINKWFGCTQEEAWGITEEIINLRKYINESFVSTSKVYGANSSYIDHNWYIFSRGW